MSRVTAAVRTRVPEPLIRTARGARDRSDEVRFQLWRRSAVEPRLQRPIFILGCPRSGTTAVVNLFATHPHVANWSEAGRVWDPECYDDPAADHCWSAETVDEEDADRLHARFEFYRRKRSKPRFVNKHPRSSVRIEYIDKVFPDALYVHVVRDGRAVANSIVNRIARDPYRQRIPFGDFCKPPDWRHLLRADPVEQAALQWREIVRYVLDRRDDLGDRYHELRYEDMCAAPPAAFAALYRFAGLPAARAHLSGIPERMRNMNAKYETDLSEAQLRTVVDVQADLLQALGYRV
jgi:hypothetical protein